MAKITKNRLLTKKQSAKETVAYGIVYMSTLLVCAILFGIILNVFAGGASQLNPTFLFSPTANETRTVVLEKGQNYDFNLSELKSKKSMVYILDKDLPGKIKTLDGEEISLKKGMQIEKVNHQRLAELNDNQTQKELTAPTENLEVKVILKEGGGIFPLILTTLYTIFFVLIIAMPIGIFAAIYLVEYDINPRLNKYIHFAIDSLAGIPSVIFGLFGMLFFSVALGLGKSLLAGILTMCIMLLPIIIKTVEEALTNVNADYREASRGLGANKTQTIFKIVLPAAIPGILVAIILAIGRIIGESAIFIFVVGTSSAFPSLFGNGSTLTAYAYNITRESTENYSTAYAIGSVIIIIVLILNLIPKYITKKMTR